MKHPCSLVRTLASLLGSIRNNKTYTEALRTSFSGSVRKQEMSQEDDYFLYTVIDNTIKEHFPITPT